jgi:hypothetical protein
MQLAEGGRQFDLNLLSASEATCLKLSVFGSIGHWDLFGIYW